MSLESAQKYSTQSQSMQAHTEKHTILSLYEKVQQDHTAALIMIFTHTHWSAGKHKHTVRNASKGDVQLELIILHVEEFK